MTTIETLPKPANPIRPRTALERRLDIAPICDRATRDLFFGDVFELNWAPGETKYFDNADAFQGQVDALMIDYLSQADGATTAWTTHARRVIDQIIPKARYDGRNKPKQTIPGTLVDIEVTRLHDPYRQILADIDAGIRIQDINGKTAGHLKKKPGKTPERVRKQWIGFDLKAILDMHTEDTSAKIQTRIFYAPLKFQSPGIGMLESANNPASARRFFTETAFRKGSSIDRHIAKWGNGRQERKGVSVNSRAPGNRSMSVHGDVNF